MTVIRSIRWLPIAGPCLSFRTVGENDKTVRMISRQPHTSAGLD